MAETIYTIDPDGTGDYSSMNACVAATAGDMGGNDIVFEVFSSAGSGEASWNILGYTNYGSMIIRPHDASGKASTSWDSSKYRIGTTGGYQFAYITQDNVLIKNLQITWGNIVADNWQGFVITSAHFIADGCYCYCPTHTGYVGNAIFYSNYAGVVVLGQIRNSIFEGMNETGDIAAQLNDYTGGYYLHNNTFINCVNANAGSTGNTISDCRNNIFQGCTTDLGWTVNTSNASNNLTDNASIGGTANVTSTTLTFTAGYALASTDTAAIDVGYDLSAVFTNDIVDTTRPVNTYYDIGAFEYVTAGGNLFIKLASEGGLAGHGGLAGISGGLAG